MTSSLTMSLEGGNTPALFDVLRIHGLPVLELPRPIRRLDAGMKLAGPAFTVTGADFSTRLTF